MRKFFLLLALLAIPCCSPSPDYASWVDPLIGSGGHGHVFVGASVPFGMVQPGPTSIPQSWDWCSGYHESDSSVIGFSHTHLSGTGIGDLFDITVMPVTGEVTYARGNEDDPDSGLWSYADRSHETAQPGYYSVPLTRYGVLAELSATERVGMHRYSFPEGSEASIVIDLVNGGCWDSVTQACFVPVMDADGIITAVAGYRYSSGWAKDQRVWFYAVADRPFTFTEPAEGYGRLDFGALDSPVQLKVAISPTSIEAACANMESELPHWDFDAVRNAARKAWNAELGRIDIKESDPVRRRIFYTALYHTMLAPALFCDAAAAEKDYTILSLWDTYRAAMPLATIIHPERMDDLTACMYRIYDRQGDLPVWHLWGNETDCMVGNPGLIVFADNVIKGYTGGLTPEQIIEAMTATADMPDRGQDLRLSYGFIPSDLYNWSVSTDLEYAIADAALANAAEALGYSDTAAKYRSRSLSYRHFWDGESGFLRGLRTDGRFSEPFNPCFSDHEWSDYVEGTPWQYLWLVPHDIEGLCSLFGSREAMLAKLDALFEAPSEIEGDNSSSDITGLIGQYAHGNEPGHHTIYIYSILGEPDKAADMLRRVYREMYSDTPAGLAGNEDAGQMSAWYVLSALGFYEVEPASGRYWFGAPEFEEATVRVAGGSFKISARGVSSGLGHIKEVRLDGRKYDLPYIYHSDIVAGGELEFIMGE